MKNTGNRTASIPMSRRDVLKVGAAGATLITLPILSACSSSSDSRNSSGSNLDAAAGGSDSNDPIVIGATVPVSGSFADEGLDQQRGLELAVQHLNGLGDGGMLNTMQPSSLQGNGILGRPVEFIVGDTQVKPSVADIAARQLVIDHGASMLIGSSSSGVGVAVGSVAEELGVLYMTGMAHANELTGSSRSAHVFRQYLNSRISAEALASTMVRDLGSDRSAYYLFADYNWGFITRDCIQQATEQLGWETVASVATPLSQIDFGSYMNGFVNSGADVLIMVHYGANMVNAVLAAQQSGIRQLQRNGKAVAMGIPVYSTIMASGARQSCAGVYGSLNWHWSLQDTASVTFTNSYEAAYGSKPSEAAHTVYVQTMQYADAVSRAGSLAACDVIAELEGHVFSGTGNGACEYRAEDHQCFKDTLVAVGRESPASISDVLEVRDTVARTSVEYAADDVFFTGALGSCRNM